MTAEVITQAATLAFSVWVLLCAVATLAAGRMITRGEAFALATPAAWFAVVVYAALKGWPS
ncbi:hypothetical protein L6R46_06100 [Myxococcota bacterium]|nr:hypothetical protein [Myxococcota bacterium]